MMDGLSGACLCGAVRYRSASPPQMVGDCYCVDCRKSSGTSHCTHAAIPADSLSVAGELVFYDRAADSGNIVSRGFCPTCGSAIYSRNSAMPAFAFIRVSSLDDPNLVAPQMTVYASRAPHWARLDTAHPVFQDMMEDGPQAAL